MTGMSEWDRRLMGLARHVAGWSKDPTQVGCVIAGPDNDIRAVGYNGFPRGIRADIDERRVRPAEYKLTEHAERNAIYVAARNGTSVRGCRLYLPWFPCMDCTRAIVQAGLAELIAIEPDLGDPIWGQEFQMALSLLDEAGIPARWFAD